MNGELVERELALAAVALVSILGAFALTAGDIGETIGPAPPASSAAWQEARVGTFGPGLYGRSTACGVRLTRRLEGIAHPVLPCGARLVVELDGRQREVRVVDKGTYGERQEFALTEALGAALGVAGTATVRWRFSQGSGR